MVQPLELLRGVGKTALGVAMVRARESRSDNRLFDDPYAQAFVDAAPGVLPQEPTTSEELAALGPRPPRSPIPARRRRPSERLCPARRTAAPCAFSLIFSVTQRDDFYQGDPIPTVRLGAA